MVTQKSDSICLSSLQVILNALCILLFFALSKDLTISHSRNSTIKCFKPKSLLERGGIMCTFVAYRLLFQTIPVRMKPEHSLGLFGRNLWLFAWRPFIWNCAHPRPSTDQASANSQSSRHHEQENILASGNWVSFQPAPESEALGMGGPGAAFLVNSSGDLY